jgi:hypothetical protein
MTTIDHAGSLVVSGSGALTDDRVARRALQVARRTAPPRSSRRRAPTAMHGCSSRFVEEVQAGGERDRVTYEQTSENWTSDGFRGRTVAPQGTIGDRDPRHPLGASPEQAPAVGARGRRRRGDP